MPPRRVVDDHYNLPKPKEGTIAHRIYVAMQQKGMTTSNDLADATTPKLNRQTAWRWFSESSDNITPRNLFMIADALEVSPRWLALDGKNGMTPPRELTPDEAAILELAANLDAMNDGSKDEWLRDGHGRLRTAKVRASRSFPYPE